MSFYNSQLSLITFCLLLMQTSFKAIGEKLKMDYKIKLSLSNSLIDAFRSVKVHLTFKYNLKCSE